MSKETQQFPSIDLDAPNPQTSNRTTPSQKRHINSLPPELLIMIFRNYCGFLYGPVSLSSVCRFWHAIVTACPILWTSITFERTKRSGYGSWISDPPIKCRTWTELERALTRAGTAPLSLEFDPRAEMHHHDDEEERVLRLFSRCHDLRINLSNVNRYTFASSITMPDLQRMMIILGQGDNIEPLIESVDCRSPLLSSLSIFGFFSPILAQHEPLLRRLVHLELYLTSEGHTPLRGLHNLEELLIDSLRSKVIEFSSSDLPKLVSLEIKRAPLSTKRMSFPLLESLTLSGQWLNVQLIDAPKLRNLVLVYRDKREPEEVTISALRRATVRPMSLSTDFISDTHLPELLELWSNLTELHLRGRDNACIPGPVTTAALAGSGVAAPLCSSLRYLTVHMEQTRKDLKPVNQGIQRLQRIVEERKNHGVTGLQRVMCVWDYWKGTQTMYDKGKEVEWVDIL